MRVYIRMHPVPFFYGCARCPCVVVCAILCAPRTACGICVSGCGARRYLAREGAALVRARLEAVLGQPRLVRETSRGGLPGAAAARRAASALRRCCARGGGGSGPFDDVVLEAGLAAAVRKLATATANARANAAPLRHAMFYGPPGTGKTMVAMRLARHCGLDYAIMSGGDVAPLGPRAVHEMHKIFEWAARSPRGVLLFVDEVRRACCR